MPDEINIETDARKTAQAEDGTQGFSLADQAHQQQTVAPAQPQQSESSVTVRTWSSDNDDNWDSIATSSLQDDATKEEEPAESRRKSSKQLTREYLGDNVTKDQRRTIRQLTQAALAGNDIRDFGEPKELTEIALTQAQELRAGVSINALWFVHGATKDDIKAASQSQFGEYIREGFAPRSVRDDAALQRDFECSGSAEFAEKFLTTLQSCVAPPVSIINEGKEALNYNVKRNAKDKKDKKSNEKQYQKIATFLKHFNELIDARRLPESYKTDDPERAMQILQNLLSPEATARHLDYVCMMAGGEDNLIEAVKISMMTHDAKVPYIAELREKHNDDARIERIVATANLFTAVKDGNMVSLFALGTAEGATKFAKNTKEGITGGDWTDEERRAEALVKFINQNNGDVAKGLEAYNQDCEEQTYYPRQVLRNGAKGRLATSMRHKIKDLEAQKITSLEEAERLYPIGRRVEDLKYAEQKAQQAEQYRFNDKWAERAYGAGEFTGMVVPGMALTGAVGLATKNPSAAARVFMFTLNGGVWWNDMYQSVMDRYDAAGDRTTPFRKKDLNARITASLNSGIMGGAGHTMVYGAGRLMTKGIGRAVSTGVEKATGKQIGELATGNGIGSWVVDTLTLDKLEIAIKYQDSVVKNIGAQLADAVIDEGLDVTTTTGLIASQQIVEQAVAETLGAVPVDAEGHKISDWKQVADGFWDAFSTDTMLELAISSMFMKGGRRVGSRVINGQWDTSGKPGIREMVKGESDKVLGVWALRYFEEKRASVAGIGGAYGELVEAGYTYTMSDKKGRAEIEKSKEWKDLSHEEKRTFRSLAFVYDKLKPEQKVAFKDALSFGIMSRYALNKLAHDVGVIDDEGKIILDVAREYVSIDDDNEAQKFKTAEKEEWKRMDVRQQAIVERLRLTEKMLATEAHYVGGKIQMVALKQDIDTLSLAIQIEEDDGKKKGYEIILRDKEERLKDVVKKTAKDRDKLMFSIERREPSQLRAQFKDADVIEKELASVDPKFFRPSTRDLISELQTIFGDGKVSEDVKKAAEDADKRDGVEKQPEQPKEEPKEEPSPEEKAPEPEPQNEPENAPKEAETGKVSEKPQEPENEPKAPQSEATEAPKEETKEEPKEETPKEETPKEEPKKAPEKTIDDRIYEETGKKIADKDGVFASDELYDDVAKTLDITGKTKEEKRATAKYAALRTALPGVDFKRFHEACAVDENLAFYNEVTEHTNNILTALVHEAGTDKEAFNVLRGLETAINTYIGNEGIISPEEAASLSDPYACYVLRLLTSDRNTGADKVGWYLGAFYAMNKLARTGEHPEEFFTNGVIPEDIARLAFQAAEGENVTVTRSEGQLESPVEIGLALMGKDKDAVAIQGWNEFLWDRRVEKEGVKPTEETVVVEPEPAPEPELEPAKEEPPKPPVEVSDETRQSIAEHEAEEKKSADDKLKKFLDADELKHRTGLGATIGDPDKAEMLIYSTNGKQNAWVTWAVIDASDINFKPQGELQERNRLTDEDVDECVDRAKNLVPQMLYWSTQANTGAPVIFSETDPDTGKTTWFSVAGEGRFRSLQIAYAVRQWWDKEGNAIDMRKAKPSPEAEAYKEYITPIAEGFGITIPKEMKHPVLVRVYNKEKNAPRPGEEPHMSVEFIAKDSNVSSTAPLTAEEVAISRSREIGKLLDKFDPGENGSILVARNRGFLREFYENVGKIRKGKTGTTDKTYFNENGFTEKAERDVIYAAIAYIINDPAMTKDIMQDDTGDFGKLRNALLDTAFELVKLEGKTDKNGVREKTPYGLSDIMPRFMQRLYLLRTFNQKQKDKKLELSWEEYNEGLLPTMRESDPAVNMLMTVLTTKKLTQGRSVGIDRFFNSYAKRALEILQPEPLVTDKPELPSRLTMLTANYMAAMGEPQDKIPKDPNYGKLYKADPEEEQFLPAFGGDAPPALIDQTKLQKNRYVFQRELSPDETHLAEHLISRDQNENLVNKTRLLQSTLNAHTTIEDNASFDRRVRALRELQDERDEEKRRADAQERAMERAREAQREWERMPEDEKINVVLDDYREAYGDTEHLSEQIRLQRFTDEQRTEFNEIIERGKKNGTYIREKNGAETVKAPNGKQSNLSPAQWVVVRTKAFKNWFGDWEGDSEHKNSSCVVDENGEPLVVYHGTNKAGFTVFDEFKARRQHGSLLPDSGFFFTDSLFVAGGYTRDYFWNYKENYKHNISFAPDSYIGNGYPGVYPCFLNIRRPREIDARGKNWNELLLFPGARHKYKTRDFVEKERYDNEHDGVIFKDIHDFARDWADKKCTVFTVFAPQQIKSASRSFATFDPSNPDIRYQKLMPRTQALIDKGFAEREAKGRPVTEEDKKAFFEYVNSLPKDAWQLAVWRWFDAGVIRVPEDADKIKAACEWLDKKNMWKNPSPTSPEWIEKWKTPAQITNRFAKREESWNPPTLKEISQIKYLSNPCTFGEGENAITIYNVDDTYEAAKYVCEHIIAPNFGKDGHSPWCLMNYTVRNGVPVWTGKEWWDNYIRCGRGIAFNSKGEPIAFQSADDYTKEWWDLDDRNHDGIPVPLIDVTDIVKPKQFGMKSFNGKRVINVNKKETGILEPGSGRVSIEPEEMEEGEESTWANDTDFPVLTEVDVFDDTKKTVSRWILTLDDNDRYGDKYMKMSSMPLDENGKKHGEEFYHNKKYGADWTKTTWVHGEKHGPTEEYDRRYYGDWHTDSLTRGQYKNDKKDGVWEKRLIQPDGKKPVIQREEYENGILRKNTEFFAKGGVQLSETYDKDGKYDGEQREYIKDPDSKNGQGALVAFHIYKNGKQLLRQRWNALGELTLVRESDGGYTKNLDIDEYGKIYFDSQPASSNIVNFIKAYGSTHRPDVELTVHDTGGTAEATYEGEKIKKLTTNELSHGDGTHFVQKHTHREVLFDNDGRIIHKREVIKQDGKEFIRDTDNGDEVPEEDIRKAIDRCNNGLKKYYAFRDKYLPETKPKIESPLREQRVRAFNGGYRQYDKFNNEFIGTGNGDGAFGYGGYFADRASAARYWAEKASYDAFRDYNIAENYGYDDRLGYERKDIGQFVTEVEFDDDKIIDWIKPLGKKQLEEIRDAAQRRVDAGEARAKGIIKTVDEFLSDKEASKEPFAVFYERCGRDINNGKYTQDYDWLISETLRDAGYIGHKYPKNSFATQPSFTEGRNYKSGTYYVLYDAGRDAEVVGSKNHYQFLRDPNTSETYGIFNRATGEIILRENCQANTLFHELVGHALWRRLSTSADKTDRDAFAKLQEFLRTAAPEDVQHVRDLYPELDGEALDDELFAYLVCKRFANEDRLERLWKNDEERTWWEKFYDFVVKAWRSLVKFCGGTPDMVDLRKLSKDPQKAVKQIVNAFYSEKGIARPERVREMAKEMREREGIFDSISDKDELGWVSERGRQLREQKEKVKRFSDELEDYMRKTPINDAWNKKYPGNEEEFSSAMKAYAERNKLYQDGMLHAIRKNAIERQLDNQRLAAQQFANEKKGVIAAQVPKEVKTIIGKVKLPGFGENGKTRGWAQDVANILREKLSVNLDEATRNDAIAKSLKGILPTTYEFAGVKHLRNEDLVKLTHIADEIRKSSDYDMIMKHADDAETILVEKLADKFLSEKRNSLLAILHKYEKRFNDRKHPEDRDVSAMAEYFLHSLVKAIDARALRGGLSKLQDQVGQAMNDFQRAETPEQQSRALFLLKARELMLPKKLADMNDEEVDSLIKIVDEVITDGIRLREETIARREQEARSTWGSVMDAVKETVARAEKKKGKPLNAKRGKYIRNLFRFGYTLQALLDVTTEYASPELRDKARRAIAGFSERLSDADAREKNLLIESVDTLARNMLRAAGRGDVVVEGGYGARGYGKMTRAWGELLFELMKEPEGSEKFALTTQQRLSWGQLIQLMAEIRQDQLPHMFGDLEDLRTEDPVAYAVKIGEMKKLAEEPNAKQEDIDMWTLWQRYQYRFDLERFLGKKYLPLVDALVESYKPMAGLIDAQSIRDVGMPLSYRGRYYVPIVRNFIEYMRGKYEGWRSTLQFLPGALIMRTHAKKDFDETADFFEVFKRNRTDLCHYIAYGEERAMIQRLLTSPEFADFRKGVAKLFGRSFDHQLTEFLTQTNNGRMQGEEFYAHELLQAPMRVVNATSRLLSLGGNFYSMLKQTTSTVSYPLEIGWGKTLKALMELPNVVENSQAILNSKQYRARYGVPSMDIVSRVSSMRARGNRLPPKALYASLLAERGAMGFTQLGDKVPIVLMGGLLYGSEKARVFNSKEIQGKIYRGELTREQAEKQAEEKAMRSTWRAIDRTQQARDLQNRDALTRSRNAFLQSLIQFRTSPLQFAMAEIRALEDFVARKDMDSLGHLLAVMMHNHFVEPLAIMLVNYVHALVKGETDDDDYEWMLMTPLIVGNMDSIPFLGWLEEGTVAKIVGEKYGYRTIMNIPSFEKLGFMGKDIGDVIAAPASDKEGKIAQSLKHLAREAVFVRYVEEAVDRVRDVTDED